MKHILHYENGLIKNVAYKALRILHNIYKYRDKPLW